ncbi:MAG: MBL fold metallo-hydrolase [Candidatus Omnitrophota bacterium]
MKRIFIVLAFILLLPLNAFSEADSLEIHFIDVDDGDATLVKTPAGRSILIDAGNLITGLKLVNYLKSQGVESIDVLVFTHPHSDHIGGVFFVMQLLDVGRVFDNDQKLDGSNLLRWYAKLARGHKDYAALKEGGSFALDGVTFKAIWPSEGEVSDKWNDNCLVIMLEFGDLRILFTADISHRVEKILLERKKDVKADILKVSHHGYTDATSEEFLDAVDPDIAVIFVKEDSPYGELSDTVPRRLTDRGISVKRTDEHGTVIMVADRKGRIEIKDQVPEEPAEVQR